MNEQETNDFIIKQLAEKIRDKMVSLDLLLNSSSEQKFSVIKELSPLITELLSKKEIRDKFVDLANSSKVKENSEDNNIKFKAFEIIRHIIIHFPFFDNWNDVFITNNLLSWNNKEHWAIKKFFSKEAVFQYVIYTKNYDKWEPSRHVKMNVKKLDDSNPLYLKDVISEDDVIWTFGLIDHYLDFMGFGLDTYSWMSV